MLCTTKVTQYTIQWDVGLVYDAANCIELLDVALEISIESCGTGLSNIPPRMVLCVIVYDL